MSLIFIRENYFKMRLTVSDRENLRTAIQNYTVNQPGAEKFEIVNNFLKQGYSLQRYLKTLPGWLHLTLSNIKRKPAAQLLGLDQKDFIHMPITWLV